MSGEFDYRQVIFLIMPTLMLMGCVLAAFAAHAKGREAMHWMVWSFLFPPTVLLLIFFCRSNRRPPRRRNDRDERDDRDGRGRRRRDDSEGDGMGSFILP
jgi:hypothetical protein